MGGKDRGPLTEPMFYVLMSFLKRDMCGTGDHRICRPQDAGPGPAGAGHAVYPAGQVPEEGLIQETEVDGRKRTYRLTGKGRAVFQGGAGPAEGLSERRGRGDLTRRKRRMMQKGAFYETAENLVTKRAPVSVLDLPGMERWLSDMAARGFFWSGRPVPLFRSH